MNDTSINLKNKLKLNDYDSVGDYVSYLPNPTVSDYEAGSINRYFVSNINYNNTIEITEDQYSYVDTKIYKKAFLNWKISGKKLDVIENKILKYRGVYNHNIIEIRKLKETLRDIENILKDPLQFWKND